VASLDVRQRVEELGVLTQRARNHAQTPDVLRMPPAGIVTAAIGVGDEGGAQRTARLRRYAINTIDPSPIPASASDAFSSRISQPRSLRTKSPT